MVNERETPQEARTRTIRTIKVSRRVALSLALVTSIITVYVLTQVPLSTSRSYERVSRSADKAGRD